MHVVWVSGGEEDGGEDLNGGRRESDATLLPMETFVVTASTTSRVAFPRNPQAGRTIGSDGD